MKEPIELDIGSMSSFISAMLMEQGKTEFTLSFERYNELKLNDYCIQSMAERGDDPDTPVSVTLSLVAVKDLPPETIGLEEFLRRLADAGDDDGTDSEGGNQ